MLEIIYQDDHMVAINKPHGLLVHRTRIANDANEFCVQLLRDQIGQIVYPVHRIDRKTSGVLLFALNKETNSLLQQKFMDRKIAKKYIALVRGYTDAEGIVDSPLKREVGAAQEALTRYKALEFLVGNFAHGKFNSSRYSLLEIIPETGRMHQIRKHMAHIRHPIIGDRPYGCNKQNRLFLQKFAMSTMLLHASSIEFEHPFSGLAINLNADIHTEFRRILIMLNSKYPSSIVKD